VAGWFLVGGRASLEHGTDEEPAHEGYQGDGDAVPVGIQAGQGGNSGQVVCHDRQASRPCPQDATRSAWASLVPVPPKPRSRLTSRISVRTWADWDEQAPRFVEIDMVGQEGSNPRGEFTQTPTVTDVSRVGPRLRRCETMGTVCGSAPALGPHTFWVGPASPTSHENAAGQQRFPSMDVP
jgi:hypothetical protein